MQGTVDCGAIDGWRRGMDTIVDLGHCGVIADGAEGIHDDLALWRQAVALGANLLVVADLVMGHYLDRPYCKYLQLQSDYNKDPLSWQLDWSNLKD